MSFYDSLPSVVRSPASIRLRRGKSDNAGLNDEIPLGFFRGGSPLHLSLQAMSEAHFMRLALRLARRGYGTTSPNPIAA
jgi:hypothetical protein